MAIIRLMQEQDVDSVRQVDAAAFNAYNLATGKPTPVNPRTRENSLAGRADFPAGCFVAEDETGISGFVFSHIWGKVGWIGVFGVLPERQKQGIGQALLDAALHSLQVAGCATIGLETMPDSPANIGLYTRHGFRPVYSMLVLEKTPAEAPNAVPYRLLSQLGDAGLDEVSRISQSAWSELNYRPVAASAQEYGWGETLLIGGQGNQAQAFATVRTAQRREGPPERISEISAMAVRAESRPWLDEAIRAVEAFTFGQGVQFLRLPLYSVDWESLQLLLRMGFRVAHAALRLIYQGEYPLPAGVDFSRWAM